MFKFINRHGRRRDRRDHGQSRRRGRCDHVPRVCGRGWLGSGFQYHDHRAHEHFHRGRVHHDCGSLALLFQYHDQSHRDHDQSHRDHGQSHRDHGQSHRDHGQSRNRAYDPCDHVCDPCDACVCICNDVIPYH